MDISNFSVFWRIILWDDVISGFGLDDTLIFAPSRASQTLKQVTSWAFSSSKTPPIGRQRWRMVTR